MDVARKGMPSLAHTAAEWFVASKRQALLVLRPQTYNASTHYVQLGTRIPYSAWVFQRSANLHQTICAITILEFTVASVLMAPSQSSASFLVTAALLVVLLLSLIHI